MNYANLRKYHKIERYTTKRIAFEHLKLDLKDLLGITFYQHTSEEMEEIIDEMHYRHTVMTSLTYFIGLLLVENNPYNAAKRQIEEHKLILDWFKHYHININTVTSDDADVLFEILKNIYKRIPLGEVPLD